MSVVDGARGERDHDRRGEGPGLAPDVLEVAERDARLLEDLAVRGLLERLARLHVAREVGVPAGRVIGHVREQEPILGDR